MVRWKKWKQIKLAENLLCVLLHALHNIKVVDVLNKRFFVLIRPKANPAIVIKKACPTWPDYRGCTVFTNVLLECNDDACFKCLFTYIYTSCSHAGVELKFCFLICVNLDRGWKISCVVVLFTVKCIYKCIDFIMSYEDGSSLRTSGVLVTFCTVNLKLQSVSCVQRHLKEREPTNRLSETPT